MESYRNATYRYSTGQGFNLNVDVPENASDVASFKLKPLTHNLGRPGFPVDIKREADRISMQVEDGNRQIKNLGYDSKMGKNYRELKSRLEVIKHLMLNYPIRYVKASDLETIYKLYKRNSPGMDKLIEKILIENKNVTGIQDFIGTAVKVRKGYPLFDQFGRVLSPKDKQLYTKGKKSALSGLAEFGETKPLEILGWILIGAALLKLASKYL